jgi:hypothetical protein
MADFAQSASSHLIHTIGRLTQTIYVKNVFSSARTSSNGKLGAENGHILAFILVSALVIIVFSELPRPRGSDLGVSGLAYLDRKENKTEEINVQSAFNFLYLYSKALLLSIPPMKRDLQGINKTRTVIAH